MPDSVGRFVVDNEYELKTLDRLARERGRRVDILLRVTPGVEPHTHKAIQTGEPSLSTHCCCRSQPILNGATAPFRWPT